MSVRPKPAPTATAAASVDRLTHVLQAGLQKLTLEVEETEMPYGSKRSSADSVKSNVEALGLELNNMYSPLIRTGATSKLLGPRLSTVTLRRTNTGTAPGVVYDDNSTVLIISADSGYGNKYLQYITKVRAGMTTAELPNIQYSFPVPQRNGSAWPSAYVTKARGHLLGLIKEATLESIGQSEFSHDYEQPLSKIFVFFKRPVSGSDRLRNDGPYIYLGRFKAQNDQNMIRPGMGNDAPSFSDSHSGRITSIGLKPFEMPARDPRAQIRQMTPPLQATEIVESDLAQVIHLLNGIKL